MQALNFIRASRRPTVAMVQATSGLGPRVGFANSLARRIGNPLLLGRRVLWSPYCPTALLPERPLGALRQRFFERSLVHVVHEELGTRPQLNVELAMAVAATDRTVPVAAPGMCLFLSVNGYAFGALDGVGTSDDANGGKSGQ